MIILDQVVKIFGNTRAVDGISFEINEGEHVVLLGTSGCGKTTTLRMVNRLTEISSGSVLVRGENIHDISPEVLRRNIGYVLQHNGLFPHYTIAENIAIVPELLKWPKRKILERTVELLEQLRLPEEYLSLYPMQLSGGQQQRVGLARALAADPPVLLMDEPFGELDAITRSSITKEFSRLEVLKNKTIILVTHDISEAFYMGNRIMLMDQGKIVQEGKPIEFLFNPKNQFVIDFFASQKMQLELNTILLEEVWPYLQDTKSDGQDLLEIDDSKNLWEAMAILNSQKSNGVYVKKIASGEKRVVGYDSLFTALSVLKQAYHE